jgi:D-galactarolactone cycloisomerase
MSSVTIKSISAIPLKGTSPKGGWAHEILPEDSIHTIIKVDTDVGISGFGSVFTNGRLVQAALQALAPLYLNETALEPVRLSEKLHQHTFWMGRGGTLTHTISGIDIALWDIFGKVLKQPVARLLGGRYRTRVQPYCSLLMEEPGKMYECVSQYRSKAFRAFKIGWGPFGRQGNTKKDAAIVRAAREACGEENILCIDAGASDSFWPHGLKWALNTADMLAEYGVHWFEEPLPPDAIDDYCELRKQSRVPIAGGEVLTRRQSFLPWLSRKALDIVQPDVTKVGGLSEQRRVALLAEDFGIPLIGHGWNTALGVAADLHMAAALPHTDLIEFIGGSAYVDGLLLEPFKIDAEGYLAVPDKPGLGVDLDTEQLAYYAKLA